MTGSLMGLRVRRLSLLVLVALSILGSACTGGGASGGVADATTGSTPLHELSSIGSLREAFNHDAGKIRLVLLISPT